MQMLLVEVQQVDQLAPLDHPDRVAVPAPAAAILLEAIMPDPVQYEAAFNSMARVVSQFGMLEWSILCVYIGLYLPGPWGVFAALATIMTGLGLAMMACYIRITMTESVHMMCLYFANEHRQIRQLVRNTMAEAADQVVHMQALQNNALDDWVDRATERTMATLDRGFREVAGGIRDMDPQVRVNANLLNFGWNGNVA
eukprot:TRINITY_DN11533_c0_g1_i1.p3 TRINITY_DN11533_c0_g1~~TRINITY_DN11533_c0_g1_i1.p3  ORF type:complete len:198 (+),score=23.44 TRINITY_DN11533_c0_g1_i1:2988-3581(+)